MAQIDSIGAGLFSDFSIAMPDVEPTFSNLDTAGEFQPLFATEIASINGLKDVGTFVRVRDVREFPAMGTPPNIVNVPVYGSSTSQQIQGQADAPSIELTLNYVASEWADGTLLGDAVGDGHQYVMRFTLLNSEPTGTGVLKYASVDGPNSIGGVENSQYYWVGKIEALQVTPNLTDANTATVTMSIQSEFYGAYTNENA